MNKIRRKDIGRAIALLDQAREILETVRDDEEAAFENMPESIQRSERGEAMEDYISALDDMISNLDTDSLQEIVDG